MPNRILTRFFAALLRHRVLLAAALFFALSHLIDLGPFNILVTFAQTTTVTGTITDTNSIPYAGGQIKAQLVLAGAAISGQPTVTVNNAQQCRSAGQGSAPCQVAFQGTQGPLALDATGSFTISLQDNTLVTPSGTQWLFTVTTQGVPPPLGTGPQTCTASVTISGASQTVTSNFSCPSLAQPGVSSGGGGGVGYTLAATFGVTGAAKWVCDATFVNGSPTVTTPVTDRPFLASDSFAVVVGGNAQCGGNAQQVITTLTPANATATFVNAHTITLSGNALASCTPNTAQGGCALFWGPDHTTNLQNAFNAASNNCGTLVLPNGGIIVQALVSNPNSLCPVTDGGDDKLSAVTVMGQGPFSTMLLFTPNMTFPSAMFSWGSGGTILNQRTYMHDFGVASFTGATAAMNGQAGFNPYFNSEFYNIWFMNFFPSNSQNFVALNCQGVINAITNCHNLIMINAGFRSIQVLGTDVNVYANWVQGSTQLLNINAAGRVKTWGNRFTLTGTQGAALANNGQIDWSSSDDVFAATGTTLPAVSIAGGAGSVAKFHNTTIVGSQTTGPALSVAASNNVVVEGENSTITENQSTGNGITNAGTLTLRNTAVFSQGGSAINNSGTLILEEGNSLTSGALTNSGTIQGGIGNCSSSASPAVCASAANGSVTIAAAATTITVNTTAVTANSQILVFEDSSLGTKLGVTCNTTTGRTYTVTARTAATSFVITASAAPAANPACLSYSIREGSTIP